MYGSYVRTYSIYIYIYIYIYTHTHTRVCVHATFLKSFTTLSTSGPCISFECTGEHSTTARRAAIMRVHGRVNLNCTFQIWAIFSHPCIAYRQLKFCVQSLLDGFRKQAKFQVRLRPDILDHSLVRKVQVLNFFFLHRVYVLQSVTGAIKSLWTSTDEKSRQSNITDF
jgi:hypothetical protein